MDVLAGAAGVPVFGFPVRRVASDGQRVRGRTGRPVADVVSGGDGVSDRGGAALVLWTQPIVQGVLVGCAGDAGQASGGHLDDVGHARGGGIFALVGIPGESQAIAEPPAGADRVHVFHDAVAQRQGDDAHDWGSGRSAAVRRAAVMGEIRHGGTKARREREDARRENQNASVAPLPHFVPPCLRASIPSSPSFTIFISEEMSGLLVWRRDCRSL